LVGDTVTKWPFTDTGFRGFPWEWARIDTGGDKN
jgi:hypothetical protein